MAQLKKVARILRDTTARTLAYYAFKDKEEIPKKVTFKPTKHLQEDENDRKKDYDIP